MCDLGSLVLFCLLLLPKHNILALMFASWQATTCSDYKRLELFQTWRLSPFLLHVNKKHLGLLPAYGKVFFTWNLLFAWASYLLLVAVQKELSKGRWCWKYAFSPVWRSPQGLQQLPYSPETQSSPEPSVRKTMEGVLWVDDIYSEWFISPTYLPG